VGVTLQRDLVCAIKQFEPYDYIILGNQLEQINHGDHDNTKTIVQQLHAQHPHIKIFGYIDLVAFSKESPTTQQAHCEDWQRMGVNGILFDDFGYDYGVTRDNQNQAISLAHRYQLSAIANAWRPDDVFGTLFGESPTQLAPGDYYLFESYQHKTSYDYEDYVSDSEWRAKAETLNHYLALPTFSGIKILAITTANTTLNAQLKLEYAWFSALLDGYAAVGWGNPQFSASGTYQNTITSLPRPIIDNPGSQLLGTAKQDRDNAAKYYVETDRGKIIVDTQTHRGEFIPHAH